MWFQDWLYVYDTEADKKYSALKIGDSWAKGNSKF